ncbi:hypothetical protein HD806DRAFT_325466 [Xylariaceae sp. AK1471]|nr:hypothetical protein HD806DRAFT_325466 [Xylariaceae sp. AK1471]
MAPAQSAISRLALRLIKRSQASRSIGNISKYGERVHRRLPLDYTHPISRHQGGSIPQTYFSRPFIPSPPNQSSNEQPTASIGIEWCDLSTERKIQWHINAGDAEWGWVVYRTCYKPEFDTAWEIVKSATEKRARQRIAQSDAPDIADKMDWVFVEDRESLEGVSRNELKRRFRDWARAENPSWNVDEAKYSRGSRFTYFVQVDEPTLLSIATGSDAYPLGKGSKRCPYVKIVRGWDNAVVAEAAAAESDSDVEDWMNLHMDTLNIDFYVELDNDEAWYSFYTPPDGICSW